MKIAHRRPRVSRYRCGKSNLEGGETNMRIWRLFGQMKRTGASPVERTPTWWRCSSRMGKMPIAQLVRGVLTIGWEIGVHEARA